MDDEIMIFAAISVALMSAASQSAAQEPPAAPVLSLPAGRPHYLRFEIPD